MFARFCSTFGARAIAMCAVAALAVLVAASHADASDQAACEAEVRALMFPYEENAPSASINRFGTSVTVFGQQEMRGYSLQTIEGSLYFDEDKTPVSLSFATGEVYTTSDGGQSWTLANSTPKEVMAQVMAGIRSQAEKATNIACRRGVELNGRVVDHYSVDYTLYNTGAPVRSEYWVDSDTRFVWRDRMHAKGQVEIVTTVDAEPAPEMTLPDPGR